MNQDYIKENESKLKHHEQAASSLYAKICRMRKSARLTIADHAIVRYQERVKLLPVGEVIDRLATDQVNKFYEKLGDGIYPTGEGTVRVVIKGGVIVTVYT